MDNPSLLPPLSLYIHIPWCVKKCPYCDFNSYARERAIPEEAYIQALIQDLELEKSHIQNRPLNSIFFGGGTPSLFSPQGIGKILERVASIIPLSSNIEITLEANPGTLEHKSFKDYQQAGINRISLGVQSFQEDKLKALGRIHSYEETKRAIDSLLKADLNSFNLDLMFGLPNQSVEDALFDLKTALDYAPPHISWYHLTIEPNTIFHHKPPILPPDETLWSIQEAGLEYLALHNLSQYEVSAYAKDSHHQCQHNLNYWQFGDYLGIGAGAHGKITTPNHTVTRYWKTRYPKSYLNAYPNFLGGKKIIETSELPLEFMLNALRLNKGVPIALFEQRTGLSLESIQPILKEAFAKELLIIDHQQILPTELGKRFLNDLLSLFLPKE
jgi:oxygen-independent coproporphyrinogen-3 oxidase